MTLFNNYGSQALYRNNYSPCSVIIDLQMLHMSWLGKEAITLSHFCLNMINWVPLPDSHCTEETNQVCLPHPNPLQFSPSPTHSHSKRFAISWERKNFCTACSPLSSVFCWHPAHWASFRSQIHLVPSYPRTWACTLSSHLEMLSTFTMVHITFILQVSE